MDKSVRSKIKWDIVLVVVILFVSVVMLVFAKVTGDDGAFVTVTLDGKTVGSYPISVDYKTEIVTKNGKNVLVIKDGKAEITFADCPDGICSAHIPISKNGESIICLPHKLAVSITDGKEFQ